MTYLISREAAIEAIDETWSAYRAIRAIQAIPAIDSDVIREAAQALEQECPWRDDTASYREWHEDRRAIATRLLAMIGEKK